MKDPEGRFIIRGNQDDPLVSVILISFNSESFLSDTLDSIKSQTYKNIELIISDDASTDRTVENCRMWIAANHGRFHRTSVVVSAENTGIASNCNRGIQEARGEILRLIAGDDALEPDCIENSVKILNASPFMDILLTQVEVYNDNFSKENSRGILLEDWKQKSVLFDDATSEMQIEYLLSGKYFPTPGICYRKDLFNRIGGYTSEYRFIEDVPFHLKALFAGNKFYFRPVVTAKYRKHNRNLTSQGSGVLSEYFKEYYKILLIASKKYGKSRFIINNGWHLTMVRLIFKLGNKGTACTILNNLRIKLQPGRFMRLIGKW